MGQIVRRIAIILIQAYQYGISPLLLPSCRYTPTCSEYARQAIERYGIGCGIRMGILRLLRCHPFHPGGYDPPVRGPWIVTRDSWSESRITDHESRITNHESR